MVVFTCYFILNERKKMAGHVNIGIPEKNRKEVCKLLQVILANEYVLYTKTLNFHWNVEDRQFHDFHAFFKDQYEMLFIIVDDVAERIRSLGTKSHGSLTEFSKTTTLKEKAVDGMDGIEMIAQLLKDHETVIQQLREDQDTAMELGDQGTNNFMIGLIEKHEKTAWMLRAHLVK